MPHLQQNYESELFATCHAIARTDNHNPTPNPNHNPSHNTLADASVVVSGACTVQQLLSARQPTLKRDVIAMVGLPARGKTFISRQLVKFLNEQGYDAAIFNVGEYRRLSTDYAAHNFFDSANEAAMRLRNKFAIDALEDLCSWLAKGDNRVAIFDATNSTRERREIIYETVVCKNNYNLMFVESVCNKQSILDLNIRHKTKSKDYINYDNKEAAIHDFKLRISHYQTRYLPLGVQHEENKYSYLQIINAGESWHVNRCMSQIQNMLTHYLLELYSNNQQQPQVY